MRIRVSEVVVPRDLDLTNVRLPPAVVAAAVNVPHASRGWAVLNRRAVP